MSVVETTTLTPLKLRKGNAGVKVTTLWPQTVGVAFESMIGGTAVVGGLSS